MSKRKPQQLLSDTITEQKAFLHFKWQEMTDGPEGEKGTAVHTSLLTAKAGNPLVLLGTSLYQEDTSS